MNEDILVCPICGAMGSIALGPPHGWREPCPYRWLQAPGTPSAAQTLEDASPTKEKAGS